MPPHLKDSFRKRSFCTEIYLIHIKNREQLLCFSLLIVTWKSRIVLLAVGEPVYLIPSS